MACSSDAKVAPRSVTIEADVHQWKDLIEIYSKGATLAEGVKQSSSARDTIPDIYTLTTAGCNNNHQVKISAMINAIYVVVRQVAIDQELPEDKIDLNPRFTYTKMYRLDASYSSGNEFGFLFTTMCDSMSVTVIKKIYPKSGTLIRKECEGLDQWGVYHDGEGGTYRQQIKINSPDCGYIPPIEAGVLKAKTCRGFDQWAEYHDGDYGTYHQLFQANSTECGYVKPPVGGTLIKKDCVGTTQWAYFADGFGGTRRELWAEKSKECGYVEPPKAGTLIRVECVGTTQWGIYADGNGGTTRSVREENSKACGYVAPTPSPSGSPTPTPSPSGSPPPPSPSPSPPPPSDGYIWKNIMLVGNAGNKPDAGARFDPATGTVRFAWNKDSDTLIGAGDPGGYAESYGIVSAQNAQGLVYTATGGALLNFTQDLFNTLTIANYLYYDRVPAGA